MRIYKYISFVILLSFSASFSFTIQFHSVPIHFIFMSPIFSFELNDRIFIVKSPMKKYIGSNSKLKITLAKVVVSDPMSSDLINEICKCDNISFFSSPINKHTKPHQRIYRILYVYTEDGVITRRENPTAEHLTESS